MQKIAGLVEDLMKQDDLANAVASRGLLNSMAYARSLQAEVEEKMLKPVQIASIAAAVNRYIKSATPVKLPREQDIQQISVHTRLSAVTYERSEEISSIIRELYNQTKITNKTYITLTQGINEITLIAENAVIETFRRELGRFSAILDITDLVGITVKFSLQYIDVPNLFYLLIRKLAFKNINIIEIVSTATELTFILDKKDMSFALHQLQKNL